MDGHKLLHDSTHNFRAPSKTLAVKELFPNGPLRTRSSSLITETPKSPPKMRSSSWNTRYDNATKRRRIESDPGDTNQKWLRGQSPPPLHKAENERPAWVINHNREAKYIDKDYQTKTRRYSHSYRSITAFDSTEEEENKRPFDHYSPAKSSNRTELATAGRQLVSCSPHTSPPLPRKYYHAGRINDEANAFATRFHVPNNVTNERFTGLVVSRDLEAQNIPSSAISKDESTRFAAHRGKQAQDLPRPLEMNRNTNNDVSTLRKRKIEMDELFQTPATLAKPLTPIALSLISITQNSPHGRALQKAHDFVPKSIHKNTVSSPFKHIKAIAPLATPERKSNAIDLTASMGRRSVRIQPAQTFVHSPTVCINQIYEGLAVDIRHHTKDVARWERESLAKGFDQAQAEHWMLVVDIQLLIGRLVALCGTYPVVDVVEPRLIHMNCELQACFDRLVDRSNVFIEMNEEGAAKAK